MPVTPGSKRRGALRREPMPVTDKAPAVIRQLFEAAHAQRANLTELARRAGPTRQTLYRWAAGQSPRLHDVEAVAKVLGLRVVLVADHD